MMMVMMYYRNVSYKATNYESVWQLYTIGVP